MAWRYEVRQGRSRLGKARFLNFFIGGKMPAKCKVTIEGMGKGILFNNPQGMIRTKTAKKISYKPEDEAEKSCYWNEDKTEIGIPSWNMRSGLVYAASGLKLPSNKKKSLAPCISGDVQIGPDFLSFGTKKYEIFTTRCVIQRQGVIKSRAWLSKWQLTFEVSWELSTLEEDFHQVILPELLTILGESVGIGDFRPAKKGPFGKFRVVSIEKI
jgi:hypothetical protein